MLSIFALDFPCILTINAFSVSIKLIYSCLCHSEHCSMLLGKNAVDISFEGYHLEKWLM